MSAQARDASNTQTRRTDRPIIVIAGPTGVGKTAIAVELCRRFDGEIVGADSVQVYRGFDIGSAKPTPEDLGGVPHHLLDVAEPDEDMDAARYARLADAAIDGVHARGRLPVVVGGTGLWLRALLRGLLPLPPADPALRAQLEREWEADGGAALFARLRQVDPDAAAKIHANDQLRIVRALEVHAQTGQPLGAMRAAHALGAPRYRSLTWVLDVPRAHYGELVQARAAAMWRAGWLGEVEGLLAQHGDRARGLAAVGYRQVVEHVQAVPARDAADTLSAICRATQRYAKRQRTWFRGDPSVDAHMAPAVAIGRERLAEIEAFVGRAP